MTERTPIRLLLVEDNPGDARLVREHLADVEGGRSLLLDDAPTLAAAVAKVRAGLHPDIVLLDLSLPDSFGLDTLARWQTEAPTLPVIVLTGSDDEALAVAAVREGAQDYLVKGRIDGALLLQAVRYAIERKLVQEDLRLAKADLERRVEERTAELRDINTRLQGEITVRTLAQQQAAELLQREQAARVMVESANRSKDEFLAILSHELRTPLNAILGWAEILRSGEVSKAEVKEGVEIIERNARSQARLVEDVLEVSRIICGKVRLNIASLDLVAVVDAALTSARPAASAKGIALSREIEAPGRTVPGDPDRLQQVVWNLLANAIKFTPGGGQVGVRVRLLDGGAEIRVRDTGIGIREDFLPYVFDRFRQSAASTTRSHGGLGLGLSITRHLVEMHGGTVTAESEGEGRGAVFTVRLPLSAPSVMDPVSGDERSPAQPGRAGAAAASVLPSLEGRHVLVVDDEADSRRLLVHLLTRAHATVREADSVPAALAILEQWPADVLVSDIAMPGENGYSLLGRLRQSSKVEWRTLPAIALTAFARAEDRETAMAAGFQMHLAKPFQPLALLTAVATLASVEPSMVTSVF